MNATQIIENLRAKLNLAAGRHLYCVLGDYRSLNRFEKTLSEAKTPEGRRFPQPLNVNRGILDAIPDDEFRTLVENEAKRPEPTAAHVAKAFESFLRSRLDECRRKRRGILILSRMELLFAYNLELNLLRTLATDEDRILLLLPGKRSGANAILYPDSHGAGCMLPVNLIAENHLWEISNGSN